MALWHIPGQGIVDDAEEGANIPEPGSFTLPDGSQITWGIAGTQRLPEYRNAAQFGNEPFAWDPTLRAWRGSMPETAPGYVTGLLDLRDRVRAGQAQPWEVEQYQQWEQQARAIPTRDIGSLTAGWQGAYAGEHANQDWWASLDPGSPDVGGIVLTLRDKLDAGQATPQERALYSQVVGMARDWDYRASVPQASDAFSPLGDNLFSALGVLGLGATGGLAAAPLFAGGAGLATTLGSLGTLAGVAGTGAGVLGQALDQPWLRNLGLGLGIAGGLAGGIGGLTNVLGSGVNSVADAARLAQSAGRVTGALGRIPGASPLQQASRYLGLAGQLGQGASGVQGLLGAAQGVTEGAGQVAGAAQDLVTQRGGEMSEWDWLNLDLGSGEGYGTVLAPTWDTGGGGGGGFDQAYSNFLGWGGDERQTGWYQSADLDTSGAGGGGWLGSVLGGLSAAGGFLDKNASWLGPAASGLAGLGAGALGSNAAGDAARLQASALNRGLDLQTAQWLQQQANQAPWLQAGQQALPQLQRLAGEEAQAPFQPGASISGADYALPGTTPGWTPQNYQGPPAVNAGDYRWTPGQGPRAADYRYTPGQTPDAANYRYTPGAVPTLSGAELLANDPGVAFRLQEGRNALEASAAARGGALSGPALAALQRQGQDLSSQEYGNAWQRASQQAQMREAWQQQATQQNFGQAMSAAQMREQMAQQASQQGWSQALAGQQAQFGQGLQSAQWNQGQQQQYQQELYNRMLQQSQLRYGQDVSQNQTDYERQLAAYNSRLQNQNTQWNRLAGLSGIGQTAVGQLGTGGQGYANSMGNLLTQLGGAQGQGALSSGNSWLNALQNMGTAAQGAFGNMQFQNQLTSLLAGLNR